ncbi:MAG: bifunctional adenosylcobinamide kinase/adenosylcobinamide-phosphate guanylyltransferase [Paracoccaceae bacterium]
MNNSLPKLALVLGGAASGKSTYAEGLVQSYSLSKTYIATARVLDAETDAKVQKHKVDRGHDWTTIEEPVDLPAALAKVPARDSALIDCATMWLTNNMLDGNDIVEAQAGFLKAMSSCPAPIVIVSNEVGHGIVPTNQLARQFREAQGRLNAGLAGAADLVVFVTAGLPQVLKGNLP